MSQHPSSLETAFRELSNKLSTRQLTLSELESSISANPELLRTVFSPDNKLLIHVAAQYDSSGVLIERIQLGYGLGNSLMDNHGKYPLHYAAQHNSRAAVEVVLRLYAVAAGRPDKQDRLPLHCACLRDDAEALPVVSALLALTDSQAAVTMQTQQGWLPLHYAAKHSNAEVVKALTAAYHHGLYKMDSRRRIPLHFAAANPQAAEEIVDHLLKVAAATAQVSDSRGYLPLHVALLEQEPRQRVVQRLLAVYPAALAIADHNGFFPIHHAVRNPAAGSIINAIVKGQPSECKRMCKDGMALHIAVAAGQPLQILQTIINAHPAACAVKLGKEYPSHLFPKVKPDVQGQHLVHLVQKCFAAERRGQGDASHGHIHVCGDGYAGKSVLSHWLREYILPTSNTSLLARLSMKPNTKEIKLEERTRGIDSVPLLRQSSQYHCHDYGGQAEYLINHANHLGETNSVYIVVVPLWDPKEQLPLDFDKQRDRYKFWLKFIFSVAQVNQDDGEDAGQQVIPIVTVINTFSRTYKEKDLDEMKNMLKADAEAIFGSTCQFVASFAGIQSKPTPSSADDSPLMVFSPVQAVSVAQQNNCSLVFPLLEEAFNLVCARNVHRGKLLLHIGNQLKGHDPKILTESDTMALVQQIVKAFVARECKEDYDSFVETLPGRAIIEEVVQVVREHMMLTLHQLGELVYVPGKNDQHLVMLDPRWARSKLLGDIIDYIKNRRVDRHASSADIPMSELKAFLNSTLFKGEHGVALCESLGLCLPLIATGQDKYYLFFALLESQHIPEIVPVAIDADRVIARSFLMTDQRHMIIPGYFYPLFAFIYNLIPPANRRLRNFYEDGLRLDCEGKYDSSLPNKVCRVQYIVHSFVDDNKMPGFDVIVTSRGITDHDFALQELDKIRQFIYEHSWNVELREYCCSNPAGPVRTLQPLREVENAWFGDEEERTLNRGMLLGKAPIVERDASLSLLLSKAVRGEGSSIISQYNSDEDAGLGIEISSDHSILLPDALIAGIAQVLLVSEVDIATEERFIKSDILSALHDCLDRAPSNRDGKAISCWVSQDMMQGWMAEVQQRVRWLRSGGKEEERAPCESNSSRHHSSVDAGQLPDVQTDAVDVGDVDAKLQVDVDFPTEYPPSASTVGDGMMTSRTPSSASMADQAPSIALSRMYDMHSGLFDYPLFPIVHTANAKTLFDCMRQTIGKQYRVKFLCPVCCKETKAGKDGDGYKLFVIGEMPAYALQAFRCTVNVLQVVGNLAGVPTRIGETVDHAVSQFFKAIIPPDVQQLMEELREACGDVSLTGAGLMVAAGSELGIVSSTLHANTVSRPTLVRQLSPPPVHTGMPSMGTPVVLGGGAVHSDRAPVPVARGRLIGPTYLSTMRQLFTGLNDIRADYCGMVRADHRPSGKSAWVCKGTNAEESICCRLFSLHGEQCLRIEYDRMCL